MSATSIRRRLFPSGSLSGSRIRSKFGSVWRTHRWFVVGASPQPALAIMCTTVSCVAWLYNDSSFTLRASSRTSVMLSSSSHLAHFSRLLALHVHAVEWQLATIPAGSAPSYHFSFHNSIFAASLHFRHAFIVFASRSFSSTRSSFFRRVVVSETSPAGSSPSCHFPFHDLSSPILFYQEPPTMLLTDHLLLSRHPFRRPFHRYINDLSFSCFR